MHVIVVFFNLVLDGAYFERNACPFSLIELHEFLDGFVVIVRAQCHQCKEIISKIIQPDNGLSFPFRSPHQGHQVRVTILHEPSSSGFNVMQSVTRQSELGITILHEPSVNGSISGDGFSPR